MSRIIRRSLQTLPSSSSSSASSSSSSASIPYVPFLPGLSSTTPKAVRDRAAQAYLRRLPTPSPSSKNRPNQPIKAIPRQTSKGVIVPKMPNVLSDRLEAEFQALRLKGQYKGDERSGRRVFWERQVVKRSRIRGQKVLGGNWKEGKDTEGITRSEEVDEGEASRISTSTSISTGREVEIIGQKIYLPNIQIRLMRNNTPPNEPYDPYIATFRIPHSMTKTDLRSYLSSLYNLPVTFIRTDNYFAPVKRSPTGGQIVKEVGGLKNYKRAVVGLKEPFHYPDDVDEYRSRAQYAESEEEREKWKNVVKGREDWLEDNFMIERMKQYRKTAMMKLYKGSRWRSKTHDNGGNVMREVMKKRTEKEDQLRNEVMKMYDEGRAREQERISALA